MCEQVRSPVLATVAEAVGAVVVSRAGRVGLGVAGLGAAAWFWPLVVGVGGGVLAGVFAMGYMLGAFRERPLWVARQHADTSEPCSDGLRAAELERQVVEARGIARAAVAELGAARERDAASTSLPISNGRVLMSAARDEEGGR